MHKDAPLSTSEGFKPEMIFNYNLSKGGVNNIPYTYTCQRMLLDVSANNGYLLWTDCNPKWNASKMYRRRLHLEELEKGQLTPQILWRKLLSQALMSVHFVQKVQSKKQGTSESTVQAASNKNVPGANYAMLQTITRQPAV
ncbi:hypothetical protein T4E_5688 [Trichinella pseudospiralis]|uniref:PiggyBac transposable element-derived protein domain-containing protein n=1 Tax=Trichinella pseudospiralis TaxID=6337 RepID=A0A0V0YIC8_TRIPS|nr:hypothetical protein T4E_5688 [Trichinella pseudospiralis]